MRIVMTDNDYGDTRLEEQLAQENGIDFAVFDDRTAEAIIEHAKGADGLITSYGDYSSQVIRSLDGIKVISRSGTGYDNIDVAAATEMGIAVCNVTDYSTEVVSDHAIGLILDCLRQITATDRALRAGVWSYQAARPLGQCFGRRLGIIGMGRIGHAVARKAKALGFRIACTSPSLTPGTMTPEGYRVLSLPELLEVADIVTIHCPLSSDTKHLLDADKLALMKPGAIVINVARGGIVDTAALAAALSEGRLGGAGLDVYETEPLPMDHPILSAPRTVLTPHTAYWSEESGIELRNRAFGNVLDVLRGNKPHDIVNPQVMG